MQQKEVGRFVIPLFHLHCLIQSRLRNSILDPYFLKHPQVCLSEKRFKMCSHFVHLLLLPTAALITLFHLKNEFDRNLSTKIARKVRRQSYHN